MAMDFVEAIIDKACWQNEFLEPVVLCKVEPGAMKKEVGDGAPVAASSNFMLTPGAGVAYQHRERLPQGGDTRADDHGSSTYYDPPCSAL